MDGDKLSREALYNAADIQNREFPIEKIRSVDVTAQHYSDVSILLEANIELARFRVCSLRTIPPQIFELRGLQVLDLSGNALHKLPDTENWQQLPNLRYLNLSDNNITKLSEIMKVAGAPSLKQFLAVGNICLSEDNAFHAIVTAFPHLSLLNDRVVTSQFRAFLDDFAVNDPDSLVPSSKMNDYILSYARYQQCPVEERNIRNANVQLFCLNRVIRKTSAADKIQSIWRGYRVRCDYKKRVRAGLFLHDYISFWWGYRRKTGAEKKRQRVRDRQKAEQTEEFEAAVRIQCFWRKKMSDDAAIIDVFAKDGMFSFCLKPEHVVILKEFMQKKGLDMPDEISETNYEIIRESNPKTVNLPGSPKIHYHADGSAIIRVKRHHESRQKRSIWCGHDHSSTGVKPKLKVNSKGVNLTKVCVFQRVRVIPSFYKPRQSKLPTYPTLTRWAYQDREEFTGVLRTLLTSDIEIRLFPEQVVESAAAETIVQASLRTFLVRSSLFKQVKQEATKVRALNVIRFCLKTIRIYRMVKHVVEVNRYYESLERSNAFYVPHTFLQQVRTRECRFPVSFGYSSERAVVLDESEAGYLTTIIPKGEIVFAVSGLEGLLKVGATVAKAQPTMFHIYIPAKHLKKYQISRIAVQRPEDALRRMALFAWVSDNFTDLMTERGVLEYCAASVIKKVWKGYAFRRNLSHLMAQNGNTLKIGYMDRLLAIQAEKIAKMRQRKIQEPDYRIGNSERESDPVEAIHELRQDYLPTAGVLEEYKSMRRPVYIERAVTSIEEVSPSAKGLGLVTDVGPDWQHISSTMSPRYPQPLSALLPTVDVLTDKDDDPRAKSPFLTESPASRERPRYEEIVSFGRGWSSSSSSSVTMLEKSRKLRQDAMFRHSIFEVPDGPQRTSEFAATKKLTEELVERARGAFSKLVRLRQMGVDIERSLIVDTSLEMKRLASVKVREHLNETRISRHVAKEEAISQTQARNRIEKEKLAEQLKSRSRLESKSRTKNARNIKHQLIVRHQKFTRDRQMGLQVASMSRLISQKVDKQRRIETKIREMNQLLETNGAIRTQARESRLAMKQQLAEIEEQKRRLAFIDKLLTENKRQIRDQHQIEYIQHLQEEKRKNLERRKLAKSRQSLPIIPEPALSVVQDELQTAAAELQQYVGAHLGAIEARTLVDLINEVLLTS